MTANSRRCATDSRGMQSCSCKHPRRPLKTKRRVSRIKPSHRPNTMTSRRVKRDLWQSEPSKQFPRAKQKAAVVVTRLKTETLKVYVKCNQRLASLRSHKYKQALVCFVSDKCSVMPVGLSAACTAEDVVQLAGKNPAILDSLVHKSNAVRPPPAI